MIKILYPPIFHHKMWKFSATYPYLQSQYQNNKWIAQSFKLDIRSTVNFSTSQIKDDKKNFSEKLSHIWAKENNQQTFERRNFCYVPVVSIIIIFDRNKLECWSFYGQLAKHGGWRTLHIQYFGHSVSGVQFFDINFVDHGWPTWVTIKSDFSVALIKAIHSGGQQIMSKYSAWMRKKRLYKSPFNTSHFEKKSIQAS